MGKKRRALVICAHISGLFIVYWLCAAAFADYAAKSGSPENLALAVSVFPGSAELYYKSGLLAHYRAVLPDPEKAAWYYEKALTANPFYQKAWYGLALARQSMGRTGAASRAMDNYAMLGRGSPEKAWDIAVFYLVNIGDRDKAALFFKKYINLAPEEQSKVYDLFIQEDQPLSNITGKLLPENEKSYSGYLRYLVRHGRVNRSVLFWRSVDHSLIDEKSAISLCDLLLDNHRFDEAFSISGELDGAGRQNEDAITNGSFERDIRNGCMDWMVWDVKGAESFYDGSNHTDGKRSLSIRFDGKHNVELYARQFVKVKPGACYSVSADMKTGGLTTSNGFFLDVAGYGCSGLHLRSGMLTGSTPWKTEVLSFTVPPGCGMAAIRIGREKSAKFDNKLGGQVWIDNVRMLQKKPLREHKKDIAAARGHETRIGF
ncbi:MAG: hypothetical protein M0Z59_01600 [Nitrospiraceae bacterium]|nr:hypothetical protein [Nitrospiraceae bacterium]